MPGWADLPSTYFPRRELDMKFGERRGQVHLPGRTHRGIVAMRCEDAANSAERAVLTSELSWFS